MRQIGLFVISLVWTFMVTTGCVFETPDVADIVELDLTELPLPAFDGGINSNKDAALPDASAPDGQYGLSKCATDCDCFDDNACTDDACVNGVCRNDAHIGGCGSTVGTCRGTWCCTSEYTCFQAYDNESVCNPP
jgi:hypothetical protein